MSREDKFLAIVFFCALLLAIFGLWFDTAVANAQDDPVSVCQLPDGRFEFSFPEAWNNPDLPSWQALGSNYDYQMGSASIIVNPLQEVEIYGEGFPEWEQNLKIGQALLFSGDYAIITVADASTPLCATITPTPAQNAANDRVAINQAIPAAVVSTGRTCVIQYPKLILVCS